MKLGRGGRSRREKEDKEGWRPIHFLVGVNSAAVIVRPPELTSLQHPGPWEIADWLAGGEGRKLQGLRSNILVPCLTPKGQEAALHSVTDP